MRLVVRRLLVAALAAWILVPGVAAAQRAAPPGFLGVVADRAALDGTVPLETQMLLIRGVGAGTVGLTFPWVEAQPYRTFAEIPPADAPRFVPAADGTPTDWSSIDARVRAAARAGLRVHPVVIAAPPWARLTAGEEFSPPADPATYAAFAAELVRRYGPGGAFWAANPDVPRREIREWQLWNEPVGGDGDATRSVFWVDDDPFHVRFVPLMRAGYAAIKAVDPGAKVVLGALVGQSWNTLQLLYDHGVKGTFDAVALHPYTARPQNVVRIVRYVRQTMTRNGDGSLPIQITELGWPAFDAPDVVRLGRRQAARAQAAWLRETFTLLTEARRELGLELLLWYTWIGRDASDRDAFDHSGLLRLGADRRLEAKPALGAFTDLARAIAAGRVR